MSAFRLQWAARETAGRHSPHIMENDPHSVGLVQHRDFTFGESAEDKLQLDCGVALGPITIRYETYGKLDGKAENAILIEHALSGDAHVAGYHSGSDRKPGWWDNMVGPGKAFDTDKYFIVCSNVVGGCSGSTGPHSINPATGRLYSMDFPMITIADMVRAQRKLMEHLGIKKWLSIAGGSMGGMQAIQWAVDYPELMESVMPIATTAQISAQSIAFNWVGRQAIMSDPTWRNGSYGEEQPEKGLSIARMLAHITYLSEESMSMKFGRMLQDSADYSFAFNKDFRVESYLQYQGQRFVERFDANSYLFITRAIDYFDVSNRSGGDMAKAFSAVKCPFLVVSFTSDWLFPPSQAKTIAKALLDNKIDVTFCNLKSCYGHDAFLLEVDSLGPLVANFLANRYSEVKGRC